MTVLTPRKIYNDLGPTYFAGVKTIDVSGVDMDIQGVILTDETGTPYSASNPFPSGPAMVTFVVTRPSIPNNESTQVIASNASRKPGSYIVNNTSSTFYLAYGAVAVLNQGVPFEPGQTFLFNTTQEIRAIQNSGGALSLDVFEAT